MKKPKFEIGDVVKCFDASQKEYIIYNKKYTNYFDLDIDYSSLKKNDLFIILDNRGEWLLFDLKRGNIGCFIYANFYDDYNDPFASSDQTPIFTKLNKRK